MSSAEDRLRRLGFPTIGCLLGALAVVIATAVPADATLYPPPVRLALLFDRVMWQPVHPATFVIPPGHLVERLER